MTTQSTEYVTYTATCEGDPYIYPPITSELGEEVKIKILTYDRNPELTTVRIGDYTFTVQTIRALVGELDDHLDMVEE